MKSMAKQNVLENELDRYLCIARLKGVTEAQNSLRYSFSL